MTPGHTPGRYRSHGAIHRGRVVVRDPATGTRRTINLDRLWHELFELRPERQISQQIERVLAPVDGAA